MSLPDNYSLFLRHDQHQEERLQQLPTCWICGEYIQQDTAVTMFGKYFCDDCLNDNRISIDD